MALVKCSECRAEISNQATNCPKCGAPVDLKKIAQRQAERQKIGYGGAILLVVFVICVFLYNKYIEISTKAPIIESQAPAEPQEPIVVPIRPRADFIKDSIKAKKYLDSIDNAHKRKTAEFDKSKAGKIQKKHPEWSEEDCIALSKHEIWIGMTYEMLVYLRGKPDHVNTSNYGNGVEYQYCWDDYSTSCFYTKSDNIVYAYN